MEWNTKSSMGNSFMVAILVGLEASFNIIFKLYSLLQIL